MSHHQHASLPCRASFAAGSEFGWARVVLVVCMHRPHEDVVGLEWCMGMPPPRAHPRLYFSSGLCLPTNTRPALVMRPSPQLVSSVGQGLCWLCVHRPHEDVVGLEWCMGLPPLVHFLNFISLLVYVSPPTRVPPLSCFLRRRK